MRWLDRHLMVGPYLTLCTAEAEYRKVLKRLKCSEVDEWIHPTALAQTHTLDNEANGIACIVCMKPGRSLLEAAPLLAHEAVHVWNRWRDHIGEDHPAEEQGAYAVQYITQALLTEYQRAEAT